MMNNSIIIGHGNYIPKKVVTNEDLSKYVDTSHEWIVTRTGIEKRAFAEEQELTSDLGTKAAQNALYKANISAKEIDLIIVATCTPDFTFPSTASIIQHKIGATNAFGFDISAACCGYITALSIADKYISTGSVKRILLIGAETNSRIIDPKDRSTYVLFGDGAGAVIIEATQSSSSKSRIIGTDIESDPSLGSILKTTGGVSCTQKSGIIEMKGKEVFRHAVLQLVSHAKKTLKKYDLTIDDVDWFIPHQANIRIIDAIEKKLGITPNKTIKAIKHHANTSAASIPLAFCEMLENQHVKRGDIILHQAIGAGLIWGTSVVCY